MREFQKVRHVLRKSFASVTMAASSVSTAYIAAAANRYSHAADVSSKSLVAFGSNKFIAIWNSIVRKI